MNIRMLIAAILAVVCGLSAMLLVRTMRSMPSGPEIEKITVVYAAADVKPGEPIQDAMLETREIPKTEAPEDAVKKPADAIGRAAMTQIDKGDLIREKKLAERGTGKGMAALIKPGMRAFTIQTPSFSSSLAGFLMPGNKVDVLLTVNSPGGAEDETGGAATTTLLQNVEILAVHTTVNAPTSNKIDPEAARSVTLLVSPDDASRLDLGQNKGTLHLSLRNLKETDSIKPKPTTLADLQLPSTIKTRPAAIEAQAPAFEEIKLRVRTLRGTGQGEDILTIVRSTSAGRLASAKTGSGGPTPRVAGPPP